MADCLARTADAVGNLLGGSLRITPERLVLDRRRRRSPRPVASRC